MTERKVIIITIILSGNRDVSVRRKGVAPLLSQHSSRLLGYKCSRQGCLYRQALLYCSVANKTTKQCLVC